MLKISSRQIIKEAGPKEKKRAKGINFDHVKNILSQKGGEVSRQDIDTALSDENNLAIGEDVLNWIEDLNLDDEAKSGRLSEHESYLLIVGAALTSNSLDEARGKLSKLNTYFITNHEIKSGSFSLNLSDLSDIEKIKSLFNEKLSMAEEWERKSSELESQSGSDQYKSNDVVHYFEDGWKVVYVPAVGEIETYKGIANTSHDRILEGNRNGLCLGSELKYYQDNSQGEIYSVRDPENKPTVTIRIENNNLEEAKGKSNSPPTVEGAIHAKEWFETLEGLRYRDNYDFRKFPPTNKEVALKSFLKDKRAPYKDGWVLSWYGNGIPELDKDVLNKIEKNDPIIIQSGLGKKYKELCEPVVRFWCRQYLSDFNPAILFGTKAGIHETYKTYKKLPEMVEAVNNFARRDGDFYFKLGLDRIPEFSSSLTTAFKSYAERYPNSFLTKFADDERVKEFIHIAEERADTPYYIRYNISEKRYSEDLFKNSSFRSRLKEGSRHDSSFFLGEIGPEYGGRFSKELWYPYMDAAAKIVAGKNPYYIIYNADKEWASPYIGDAVNKELEHNPLTIITRYETNPELLSPYLHMAVEKCMERNPADLLRFIGRDWLKPYRKEILDSLFKNHVFLFLKYYIISSDHLGEDNDGLLASYAKSALERISRQQPFAFMRMVGELEDPDEYTKDLIKPYLGVAAEVCINDHPIEFISNIGRPKEYIPLARKRTIEMLRDNTLSDSEIHELNTWYSSEDWTNEKREELGQKSIMDAVNAFINNDRVSSKRSDLLLKLAKALFDFGHTTEAKNILSL